MAFEVTFASAQLGFPAAELDMGYARGLEAFEAEIRSWIQRFQVGAGRRAPAVVPSGSFANNAVSALGSANNLDRVRRKAVVA